MHRSLLASTLNFATNCGFRGSVAKVPRRSAARQWQGPGWMFSPLKPRVNAMIIRGLRSIGRALLNPLLLATPHGKSYRPEIDGLRALAVLVVIANHLNSLLAPTGFRS
jgi:hypothetical protein